jgi:hypothetical protein
MNSNIDKRYAFNVSNQYIFKYILSHFDKKYIYFQDNLKLKMICLQANECIFLNDTDKESGWYCKTLHTDGFTK